jgi:hypothetical protein
MVMRLTRTIIGLFVALSVAVLPVTGSASIVVTSPDTAASAPKMGDMHVVDTQTGDAQMSAAMDCCPDQTMPCDPSSDYCQAMASCAVSFLSLANIAVVGMKYPPRPWNSLPLLMDQAPPPHGGSPPFRPPRV